ncbi:hypothetical protein K503DRAFT_578565 [Rhizopogon vinicolor AM-OR11-026]|uniref:Uncharacterized protein n=1 Tax=Rhizopogon vinicolor AM-OR11-026 TaxID=1314800 RepID=A0A1B7NGW2_9AGAM|nr:hypothetical protein K503DRAFT_578565 [Rhizopogon vinicolor AM-OR11-026]
MTLHSNARVFEGAGLSSPQAAFSLGQGIVHHDALVSSILRRSNRQWSTLFTVILLVLLIAMLYFERAFAEAAHIYSQCFTACLQIAFAVGIVGDSRAVGSG